MGAVRHAARRLAPHFLWRSSLLSSHCSARQLATAAATQAADPETWPVVVVGGGPTGLATAILLSKYGVPSLVLERRPTLTDHPQAHFINMRAMEVFRCLDGLSQAVTDMVPPLRQWRQFVYCDTMTGHIMGRVDHFKGQTSPYMPTVSPEPVAHLAQHRLLPLMAERAAARPDITLRMGHHVSRFEQDGEGVRAVVQGPEGRSYTVHTPYLVAADGARGDTRTQLGIGMEGPGGIQHLINVHFVSPELGRLVRGREGMLYFVFGTSTIAVVVAHNIDAGEFVAQVPYFPPLQRPEDFTPAVCASLMRTMAGVPDLPLEVRTIRPWTMSGRVAQRYQQGRVFLVGDAAHHFPPSGAFGMNTGVCDAHNLAWKLAAVLGGAASPRLLDSYTPERKPVGLANMRLSADNFYEELRVPAAIGLDFYTANMLSDALAAPALSFIPTSMRQAALNTAFSAGMAASGVLRRVRQRKLDGIFGSGETLRLQFPKEDLGFVYSQQGAAVCRSAADDAALKSYLRPKSRQAPYEPCTLPGARFPHCALSLLSPGPLDTSLLLPPGASAAGAAGVRQAGQAGCSSTLDVVAAAGTGLTLFLSDSPALPAWLAAAAQGTVDTGVKILPVVVVTAERGEQRAAQLEAKLGRSAAVALNADGAWEGLRGVGAEGALLVRPDGHVAWRHCEGAGLGGGQQGLAEAVRAVMGLEGGPREPAKP